MPAGVIGTFPVPVRAAVGGSARGRFARQRASRFRRGQGPGVTRKARPACLGRHRNAERKSTMCKVLNKHQAGIPANAVYIGRGSKWGNPFRIGLDGDRAAVIAKYERWLAQQPHLLRSLDELRGRDLVCFCAPCACHGDLLLRLANATREARIAWWRAVQAAA
jgi:hypothetical protein